MAKAMVLNSNFVELNSCEMMNVHGGGALFDAVGMTFACTLIAITPVVIIACPPAGVMTGLTGAGLLGKTTGWF